MISLPNIVDPPDLVLIEVLDTLPGRPISGERLVRPDGKISIGFYGEVYVSGLTQEQVKVAIIKQLRTNILTDEALGLEVQDINVQPERLEVQDINVQPVRPKAERPKVPELPPLEPGILSNLKRPERQDKTTFDVREVPVDSTPSPASFRLATGYGHSCPARPIRSRVIRVSAQDQKAPAPAPNPIQMTGGAHGKVTITIELDGQGASKVENSQIAPVPAPGPDQAGVDEGTWRIVPPAESPHVFVDITAYNSKNYYVLGDS